MIRAACLVLAVSVSLLTPSAGLAQSDSGDPTGWSVGAGIGFHASPTQFLFQLDAPYYYSRVFSLGPTFQLGSGERLTTIGLTLDGKAYFGLFGSSSREALRKSRGYVGLGIGFNHYGASGFAGETNLLIPVIVGAQYALQENLMLTSEMRFNIAATSDTDNFYFSWQMVGLRLGF